MDIPQDCQQALQMPIMQQIYQVESSRNQFAIGVVAGRLVRQPKELSEAVATANYLASLDRNFSIGIGQVNRIHFERLGWKNDIQAGFDLCSNAIAAHSIYQDCFQSAKSVGFSAKDANDYGATHAALSCYYSGSHTAGKGNADVRRYINAVLSVPSPSDLTPAPTPKSLAIPLAESNRKQATPAAKAAPIQRRQASMLASGAGVRTSQMMLANQDKQP